MENLIDRIKQLAHAQREEVIEWRRWMHRHPDLSQEEYGTMEFVAERLRAMGLEPKTGIGKTGVMAMLRGNEEGGMRNEELADASNHSSFLIKQLLRGFAFRL